MELLQILATVWRRKWIIIQAFLVIFLTAAIGTEFLPSVYETSSKILIENSESESYLLSSIGMEDFSGGSSSDSSTENHIALATSDPILLAVIEKLQLQDRKETPVTTEDFQNSAFIVSNIFPEPVVNLEEIDETNLIEITATSNDPIEAAMIANTLAEIYIEQDLKQKKEGYKSAKNFLLEKIESVRSSYMDILERIKTFQIEHNIVDLDNERENSVSRIFELMAEKETTILSIIQNKAKTFSLKQQLNQQSVVKLSSSTTNDNSYINTLQIKKIELELQLEEQLTDKNEKHPDIILLNQKIFKINQELKKEITIYKDFSTDLQSLQRELAALEAYQKTLDMNIQQYQNELSTYPNKTFINSQLELDYEVNQELYRTLLESLYEVGLTESMLFADIRLVESAAIPEISKPDSPNKKLNWIIGIILGTMVGFSLGFLVDYLDNTVKSPDELSKLGVALLGTVPKMKKKSNMLISSRNPKDPICEAYRTIRSSIKFSALDTPLKTLLITSAIESEGKSTTAANLAISFASEGKKTLLIDLDLRKPSTHEIFELSNRSGVINILSQQKENAAVIQKSAVENLDIITTGPPPPNPARMIESQKIAELIKECAQSYDMVIIDTPPSLIATDAIILSAYTDGLINVIESGRETIALVEQYKELLARSNITPLGTILNKFKISGGRTYGNYYYSHNQYTN